MSSELDRMLELWKVQSKLSEVRAEQIRMASKSESAAEVMSIQWWKSVLIIPHTVFIGVGGQR